MEQEKNKNGVIALLVVIIVILSVLCVLFATGTIVFKSNESNNNQIGENGNSNVIDNINNTKEDLNSTEISELNDFFDVYKNNNSAVMQFIAFSNRSELLNKNTSDSSNNSYYLSMILCGSKYATLLTDSHVRTGAINLSNIKKQLKELTNYEYSDDEVKNYFGNFYKSDKDTFEIPSSGGTPMPGTITNSYKIGDMYYISLSNNINVVLQKNNNEYYYYSSTGWTE